MLRLSVESIARAESAMEASAAHWVAGPLKELTVALPARSLLQPIDSATQILGMGGHHSPGDKVTCKRVKPCSASWWPCCHPAFCLRFQVVYIRSSGAVQFGERGIGSARHCLS